MVATWNYNREYEGIEISFDGKPSEEIRNKMKSAGFRWSSRQMKWYAKDTQQSRKVASEIATQGEDVGEVLTFEQKMERDKERTEQRQGRLGAKVEKLEKKSEALLDQAHKMADVIPFGQPILVGHHSEGRDRRYRDKIHNKFGKGFELQDEAKAVEQRLEGSQALARKRETPGYMSRKIDKLEAGLRKFEREKEQWKTAMPEWEKRTGKLKEEITYWKKELAEAGGLKVTSADVNIGDEILYLGTWYEVVRVNPKTVTIKNWLGVPTMTWGAEYDKIKEVRHKSYETPLEPKPKIPDAEYEKAKLFLSALATARTLDELLSWQPAVKRWSIKFPELEKELESEYQARFDYLKAVKDVSEAQRKEKASKPQSDQAKDLYKQMRKTNSVQELDDWRNRVLFEAHLPDVEEDILLRDLAAKWRVYLETRGIPALEKLDKLPLDYKNEDYYFGTEVWIHPTTAIFDDRPQKGILHFARNEGELFDVMLEGVPGTTRVQIDKIYVTKLVEKPEPRYQASSKKIEDYKGVKYTIDKDNYVWVHESPYPKLEKHYISVSEFKKHVDTLEKRQLGEAMVEWTPQQAIKLAVDTVETLRKPDVFRVLSQNKSHAKELGAFIKSKRADLANEVEKILFEFTLPTYELYFWRLTHTPHLKEKWHIEYKVAEISDRGRREFSSFGSRYFETWEEIRNILASGTANLWVHDVRGDHTVTFKPVALGLFEKIKPVEIKGNIIFGKPVEVPHGKPKNLTCYKCGEKFQRIIDTEQKTITCPKCHEQIEIKKSEELDKDLEAGQRLTLMNREKRAESKEVLVFGQPEDTEKFIEEFGKPIHQIPEKPRVLGASSKQELTLKEARKKASEGKKLRGQVTLFGAVSTAKRLESFEEKPKRAEPLKFKRPIPVNVVGRLRSPPYPFIRPKPKLLAMPSEQEIQKVKQSKEAELHARLMLIAEKTRLKRERELLKKEVE